MAMTTDLLSLRLCVHIPAAAGLMHELQPVTLELENLYAAVILLKLDLLRRQLPIRIAASRFDLLALLAEGFKLTVKAFDLMFERLVFRKPHRATLAIPSQSPAWTASSYRTGALPPPESSPIEGEGYEVPG